MARTIWGQGPDKGDESVRPPEPAAGEPPKDPVAPPYPPVAVPEKGVAGATSAPPRPTRTTPGGSGLAALLIQNRTKTGKHKILEGEGAVPERTRSPTESFELMEVTAVGGSPLSKSDSKTPIIETGPGAGRVAPTVPVRASYPTPGGGLPGLLMRTQLGLGEAVQATIQENGQENGQENEQENGRKQPPVTLAPLRSAEPGASGFDTADTTAVTSEAPPTDGPETEAAAPVSAEAAAVPFSPPVSAFGAELSSPSSSASVPIVDAGSGGVVALPSGPVFDLASTPLGQEGSGGTSGPVFDLVSGPITGAGGSPVGGPSDAGAGGESSGPLERAPASGVSRSPRHTPTSGRLAALLAESRKRTGGHQTNQQTPRETTDKTHHETTDKIAASSSGPTAVGRNDVATVRVPGASLSETKGPGFAATLLGLPGPDQQAIEAALASVRGGRSPSARPAGHAGQNTPLPVEGEATERSLLSTADVRRGWQRGSGEEKRITEVIEVVPAARRARIKAAVVIAGGVLAIGGVIFLGSLRKPKRGPFPAVPALGARLAAPALEETTPPAREPAAEGAIGRADEAARAGGAAVATPGEEGAPAAAARPAAVKAPERDEPAPAGTQAAAAADDDHVAAAGDTGTGSPASNRDAVTAGEGDRKRTMAHSEPRRSDTGHAEPKSRRRSSEVRGARAVGPANGGPADTAQPSRTHGAQPSRAPEIDPDGTLPLGIR